MTVIIFKNGLYNGIDREITYGEVAIELPKVPHELEKTYEGKVVSFLNDPYCFTEKEVLEYKEHISTFNTFFYNSKLIKPSADSTEITSIVNTHLSRDGFILEPNGSLEITIDLGSKTEYIKMIYKGSYIKDLSVIGQLDEELVELNSSNEFIADNKGNKLVVQIDNPSDRVIIINELIFLF